jgi:tyrosine-protein kinase Etk/Wzc
MTFMHDSPKDNDEIDLRALIGPLIDRKWWVAAITASFLILSTAYAWLATPIYQATALIQVEPKTPDLPGLSDLVQTLDATSSQATTEIALLSSRMVVGQAVNDLHLDIRVVPYRFPLFGGVIARRFNFATPDTLAAPAFGMNRYDWGGSRADIVKLDVPNTLLGKKLTLIAGEQGSYRLLNENGDTLLQGKAGETASHLGVTLLVDTLRANPGTHFRVIRQPYLQTVSQLQQDVTEAEQGKDSGIILLTYRNPDPFTANALLDTIGNLYVKQNVERNAAQAASSLRFVQQQLPKVKADLEHAQAALSNFQTKAGSVDLSLQTKSMLDQAVAVETSLEELRQKQADTERLYTRAHPAYQALMKQMSQLQAQKGDIEKQIANLPDTQKELLRLTRDVEVSNQIYTSLLNQAQQLDIARAGTVGNVRIIDASAVDATQPVWPKKILVIVGGAFLGLFLSVALILTMQWLKRGMEDPSDIEALGLSVYASIPFSDIEGQRREYGYNGNGEISDLLVAKAPADVASEAIRSLRTGLHFAQWDAPNNVVMITSCSPGAGKSFVSSNLAATIAQNGQKVLLIDADMRRGNLHKVLGGRSENGLSELISEQIHPNDAIRSIKTLGNLQFIARGSTPPNPSELLMSARFSQLLQKLRNSYDVIIIDTPPVLAVTDASIIGSLAGTSLLVVRFGVNQSREIELVRRRLAQGRVEIKGAIFNAVQRRHNGFYSYGYYEYASQGPT